MAKLILKTAKIGSNAIQLELRHGKQVIKYEALIDGGSTGPTCTVDDKPCHPGTAERVLIDGIWDQIMKYNDDLLFAYAGTGA